MPENMPDDVPGDVRRAGCSARLLGIAYIALGIACVAVPFSAGLATAMTVGALMVAAGVMQIVWAFQGKSWAEGLLGLLYAGAGIFLLMRPMMTLVTLTLMLASTLIIIGLFRLGFGIRFREGRIWNILGAVLAIALGGMLIAKWPLSSEYAIGVLVGVELLFSGITLVTVGGTLRALGWGLEAERAAARDGGEPGAS